MHRFFLPTIQAVVDETVSLGAIHNQLFRVLRVHPGTQVVVLDNAGYERLMEIATVERRDTMARVIEVRPAPVEPTIGVTLYQCILKSDKFDLVLQKATELGVTTIVPVVSNRTVARLGRVVTAKIARWETIVREAAEQSGRGKLPVVAQAVDIAEALTKATGARLLPWEEGQANPGLLAALRQSPQPVEEVSILIGPEGGFDPVEIEAAIEVGWQVVSMGQRILRAETAAMAALTIVTAALGELGDAPLVKLPAPAKADDKQVSDSIPSDKPKSPVEEKVQADSGKVEVEKAVKPTRKVKPKASTKATTKTSTKTSTKANPVV